MKLVVSKICYNLFDFELWQQVYDQVETKIMNYVPANKSWVLVEERFKKQILKERYNEAT